MIDLFSVPMILLYAILYGTTMKIADLFNEHGLKSAKYADLFFGVMSGIFGAMLVLSNNIIANIVLAMNIAFILRRRIDRINHALSLSIIAIAFLISIPINIAVFLAFYFIFLIFGGLKDYVDDVMKKKKGLLVKLNEAMLYYPIPTFIYCMLYGNWIVFYAFLLFMLSYNLTKYYAAKHGYD